MRLFTGIEIPDEATAALMDLMEKMRRSGAKLRWTSPEKLHLTLTFIGEWPEEKLSGLKEALARVDARGPVPVSLRGVGWLPSPRFPRTLYAGVEPAPELLDLAGATARAAASAGVAVEERSYHPHVTLARVRGRIRGDALPVAQAPIAAFQAPSFFLYLSSGGKYTKLEEFRLNNSPPV
jgi:2'-5' RNA ligase